MTTKEVEKARGWSASDYHQSDRDCLTEIQTGPLLAPKVIPSHIR